MVFNNGLIVIWLQTTIRESDINLPITINRFLYANVCHYKAGSSNGWNSHTVKYVTNSTISLSASDSATLCVIVIAI